MENTKVVVNEDWEHNILEIEEFSQNLKVELEIVYHSNEWQVFGDLENAILAAAQATFSRVRMEEDRPILISLALSDDVEIRRLNDTFRGKDKATNVLSFPAGEDEWAPADGPVSIGDIILAYETVMREAEEQKLDPMSHIIHLVIHGILHILGFDHENDHDAEIMEGLEKEILGALNITL